MRVLIIGAGGVGSVLARALASDRAIEDVVCATDDLWRAREFLRGSRVRTVKIDAGNENAVAKCAKGFDLVVNASLPQFNLTIMRAALRANAHYQDLCSHIQDRKTAEQLQLHKRFQKAGRVALINTGAAPGISNLLARNAADMLTSIRSIKIRTIEDQQGDAVFAWSPAIAVDAAVSPPLTYQSGKFQHVKNFDGLEDYAFPEPYGERRVVSIFGDEVSTIPLYIDTEHVDMKACGADIDVARALFNLGQFDERSVRVGDVTVQPKEVFLRSAPQVPSPKDMRKLLREGRIERADLVVSIEAKGKKNKTSRCIRLTAAFPDLRGISRRFPGATYIAYATGIAAAGFARTLPMVDQPGVFPPEALSKDVRRNVITFLRRRGVRFVRQVRTV